MKLYHRQSMFLGHRQDRQFVSHIMTTPAMTELFKTLYSRFYVRHSNGSTFNYLPIDTIVRRLTSEPYPFDYEDEAQLSNCFNLTQEELILKPCTCSKPDHLLPSTIVHSVLPAFIDQHYSPISKHTNFVKGYLAQNFPQLSVYNAHFADARYEHLTVLNRVKDKLKFLSKSELEESSIRMRNEINTKICISPHYTDFKRRPDSLKTIKAQQALPTCDVKLTHYVYCKPKDLQLRSVRLKSGKLKLHISVVEIDPGP